MSSSSSSPRPERLRKVGRHFSLGPAVALRIDAASERSTVERTAWDSAVVATASAFDRPRSAMGAIQFVVSVAVGYELTNVDIDSIPFRWLDPVPPILLVIVAALAVYWLIPTVIAGILTLDAPRKQRDDARAHLIQEQAELKAARDQAAALRDAREQLKQRELRRQEFLHRFMARMIVSPNAFLHAQGRVDRQGQPEDLVVNEMWGSVVRVTASDLPALIREYPEFDVLDRAEQFENVLGRKDDPPKSLVELRMLVAQIRQAKGEVETLVRQSPVEWE